jgi:hypothetical protein
MGATARPAMVASARRLPRRLTSRSSWGDRCCKNWSHACFSMLLCTVSLILDLFECAGFILPGYFNHILLTLHLLDLTFRS